MHRRQFIQTTSTGAAALGVLSITGCSGKSVAATVMIITGAIQELKPLYPGAAARLDEIVKLATDFNNDWIAGNFDSAKAIFQNLDTLIGQVITDLSITASTKVKLLLATIGIALRTIAAIIAEQGATAGIKAGNIPGPLANRLKVLTNAQEADQILKLTR